MSLDGLGQTHDNIRGGDTFNAVCMNIQGTDHPNVWANITINKENANSLEEILRFVSDEPQLKGLMINFHIPYPGQDCDVTSLN